MQLTHDGHLPPGSAICDIGATQLFGAAADEAVRSCLAFYAARHDAAMPPERVSDARIREIANGGFIGDLLLLAGFRYTAIDIFHATNTILFDLNVHEPGPDLAGAFDLVMNLGTTEHVFNQLRAFQTIHALTKPGGAIYHDLPMSGFMNHALFRYDPLFFRTLVAANPYDILVEEITPGAEHKTPPELLSKGYPAPTYMDMGIELILRRRDASPFRIPLETTTSLSVDPTFEKVQPSTQVRMPEGTQVIYGAINSFESMSLRELTATWLDRVKKGFLRPFVG
jgi:SAM-dependent methyltransferase